MQCIMLSIVLSIVYEFYRLLVSGACPGGGGARPPLESEKQKQEKKKKKKTIGVLNISSLLILN